MEICVLEVLLEFLEGNNLLSKFQHGFLPGKSTLTQLVESLNDWVLQRIGSKPTSCADKEIMSETSVVLDKCIEAQLEQLQRDHEASPRVPVIGIVVGTKWRGDLIAVHLAPCPKPEPLVGSVIEEISEDDIMVEATKEEHVKQKKKAKKSTPGSPPKLPLLSEYIDEQWILDHARKLWRGLPGGLNMIGLFFIGDKRARSELSTILMRGLTLLQAESTKALRLVKKSSTSDKTAMLLTIELPAPGKPEVNVIEASGILRSNVRFRSELTRWAEVATEASLDVANAVSVQWEASPDINKEQLFELTFLSALKPFCISLLGSKAMIDGQLVDLSDPLVSGKEHTASPSKSRKREQLVRDLPKVNMQLLMPPSLQGKSSGDESVKSTNPDTSHLVSAVVTLRGTMACKGFVPRKASVGEGITALQLDIIRSLMARCRLHSEGLFLLDPDQGEVEQLHQFPRRAFCKLPSIGLDVCDYAFEGDLHDDIADTLRHTFTLKGVGDMQFVFDSERTLDYENMVTLGIVKAPVSREGSSLSGRSSEASLEHMAAVDPVLQKSNFWRFGLIAAFVFAFLAVVVVFAFR